MFVTFFVTVLIIVGIVAVVWLVAIPRFSDIEFGANREEVDYHGHHGLDQNVTSIVWDGRIMRDVVPFVSDDRLFAGETLYLPVSFLRDVIDPFIFWDEGAGVLFISSRQHMLEFTPDSLTFLVNNEQRSIESPIIRDEASGEFYLPQSLVESLYPIIVEYIFSSNIMIITPHGERLNYANIISASAPVRTLNSIRGSIVETLAADDTVIILGEIDDDTEFVSVRTHSGFIGYLATRDIGDVENRSPDITATPLLGSFIDNLTRIPPNWPSGAKINMTWDLIYQAAANQSLMQTPLHSSVNVISPTWFRFDADNLNISSVASRDYVDWAHRQGVHVWPLLFDVNNATARAILMNRSARQTVIAQLVQYVDTYNLDGINIDIEHLLSPEEGPYKIQFLRELAIPMRQRNIVLSAAVKVPTPWTMFYRRDLIGLTMDFVQVMTYDEHWATSPNPGPVASIPWVDNALIATLREVPAEQLIMGLPFYSRIWREVALEEDSLTSRALGMGLAREFFAERGVTGDDWDWLDDVGSYFAEIAVIEEGQTIIYRVWLEDEASISVKMHLFSYYNLVGVSSWFRGLESPGTWDVIAGHF